MKKTAFAVFLLPLLLFFNYQTPAQSSDIVSIEIVSIWSGLGTPAESRLFIKQKKGRFYAGDKKIDSALVDELLKTLAASSEKLNPSDFGITQAWLDANAEKALPEWVLSTAQSEKDLFFKSFRDIKFIEEKILPRVALKGGWSDDYPRVRIEIVKTGNSKILVSSRRQPLFMLPWEIVENGQNRLLFNPKFSRAVANLLAKKFTNRERIGGYELASEMGEKVHDEIKEKLQELETQNKIGAEFERIKDRYTIRKTAISRVSSIDTGTPMNAYQVKNKESRKWNFPSWNAELKRNDLPANVIIGVSLPYKEGRLATFDAFLANIDAAVSRALSVEWLARQIAANPETEFEIRFVGDRSFSVQAQESFLEDLKAFGANALKPEILSELDKSVFLRVSEKSPRSWSHWLILPDKRMILWRIQGDSALKWKPDDFEKLNLYDAKDWFQTKAIISRNGEIESR